MAATVQITDGELGGLRLIHPDDPEFDRHLPEIYGENAGLVANLKPHIVMVVNDSPCKVIAYSILVENQFANGQSQKYPCMYMYAEAAGLNPAMPRGGELFPEEKRVVTLDYWCIDPRHEEDLDYFLRQHKTIQAHLFGRLRSAEISLDATIQEDGLLSGFDIRGMAERFTEIMRDRRALYRELLDSPDPMGSLKTLFRRAHYDVYLKGTNQEGAEGLPDMEELLRRQREFSDLRVDSITTTNSLRSDHGSETVLSAMRGALQNQELTVRRQ